MSTLLDKDFSGAKEVGMDGRSSDIIEHRDLSILPLLLEPRGTLAKFKKEEKPKNSLDLEFHSP